MKRFSWALLAVGMLAPNVHGVVIFEDNFDSYADQAAFVTAWPRYNCISTACGTTAITADALLVQDIALSAPNSVNVPGSAAPINNQHRQQHHFDQVGFVEATDKIAWSFDFYDSSAGNPARNYSNLHDQITDAEAEVGPTATNQLIAMGLNNNQLSADSGGNFYMARILGFTPTEATLGAGYVDPEGGPNEKVTGASQFIKLNDYLNAPLRSVGWHNLKVELTPNVNLAGTDYNFYVDNILSETVLNIGTIFRRYDTVVLGSGVSNASISANFDNVLVQFNPPAPPAINADFNGNLEIDAADYVVWRDNNPTASGATRSVGDSDGDGDVDDDDYVNWKATFGNAAPPGSGSVLGTTAAVPEPSTLILLLGGVAALAIGRRR